MVAVIDAGTSSIKVFLHDGEKLVSSRRIPWVYSRYDDTAREFDPDRTFSETMGALEEMAKEKGIPKDRLKITATSQREGMVAIDERGREVYCGTNLDLQALFTGFELEERIGEKLYRITGHRPPFLFAPAKILFLSKERGLKRGKILPVSDWFVFKMTGEVISTVSSLSEIGVLDIEKREPACDLLEEIGVDGGFIPDVGREGEEVGDGVFLGAPDSLLSLFPFVEEDEIGIVTGWSITSIFLKDKPVFDPEGKIWSGCHINGWFLEGNSGDAGSTLSFMRGIFFPHLGEDEAVREMEENMGDSRGVLLSLGPGPMDMKGLPVRRAGILFPAPPSLVKVGRGEIFGAFFDSIAFSIRSNMEKLEMICGRGRKIFLLGRWAYNKGFTSILPSVLNRDVEVFVGEPQVLGAFALISGEKPDVSLEKVRPDPLKSSEYEESYKSWLEFLEGR